MISLEEVDGPLYSRVIIQILIVSYINDHVDDNAYGISIASPIASKKEGREEERVESTPSPENEHPSDTHNTGCIGQEDDFDNAHRMRRRQRSFNRDDGPRSRFSGTGSKATRGLEPGGPAPGALQIRTVTQILGLRMPVLELDVSPTPTEQNLEDTGIIHMRSNVNIPTATTQSVIDEAETSRAAESINNQRCCPSRKLMPLLLEGLLVVGCATAAALIVTLNNGTKDTGRDGHNPLVASTDPCFVYN